MPVPSPRARVLIAALAFSAAGLVGLVQTEGYTDRAVIPIPGDVPTIGPGLTTRADGSPVQMGDTITVPAALVRSLVHIQKDEAAIKRCVTAPLHQWEYDAYVYFSYNIGSKRFCSSTLVKKLNAGDYRGACDQILQFKKAAGKDCSVRANKCYGLWKSRLKSHAQCLGPQ